MKVPAEYSLLQSLAEVTADCVKCGKCLAGCPTYRMTAHESGGMRGRLALMQASLQGFALEPELAARVLQRCTLCASCARECPNEVATIRAVILGRLLFFRRMLLRREPLSAAHFTRPSEALSETIGWWCSGLGSTKSLLWASSSPVSVVTGFPCLMSVWSTGDLDGFLDLLGELIVLIHNRSAEDRLERICFCPDCQWVLDHVLPELEGNDDERSALSMWRPPWRWLVRRVSRPRKRRLGRFALIGISPNRPEQASPSERQSGTSPSVGGRIWSPEWEALIFVIQARLKEPLIVMEEGMVCGSENALSGIWPDLATSLALSALDDLSRRNLSTAIVIGQSTQKFLEKPAHQRGIEVVSLFEFLEP